MKHAGDLTLLALAISAVIGLACGSDGDSEEKSSAGHTYSDVLATYPSGVELCRAEAVIVDVNEEQILFDIPPGAFGIEMLDFEPQYRCYGAKLTVGENTVTLDGETYGPGSKLTFDKNLEWVVVSSWD